MRANSEVRKPNLPIGIAVLSLLVATGCGGGGGGGGGAGPVQPADSGISGRWTGDVEVVQLGDCGHRQGPFRVTMEWNVTGNQLQIQDSLGDTWTGTVNGDNVQLTKPIVVDCFGRYVNEQVVAYGGTITKDDNEYRLQLAAVETWCPTENCVFEFKYSLSKALPCVDPRPVQILYKTFIKCNAVKPPPDLLPWRYMSGDDRDFSFTSSESRSSQLGVFSFDPEFDSTDGQVGTAINNFGVSRAYDDNPRGSDIKDNGGGGTNCSAMCRYEVLPTATPECVASAQPGDAGNILTMEFGRHPTESGVRRVTIVVHGINPCGHLATPAIDVQIHIDFRTRCDDEGTPLLEYRLSGKHDGFPWHELYLDGIEVFRHDPCITNEGPSSLFPPMEHVVDSPWKIVPDRS